MDPKAKKIIETVKPYVETLLLAKAAAELERERVDKIQRAELASQNYYGRLHDGRQIRITDPRQSYLMDDASAATYFAKLNAIHLANGFEGAKEDKCPALCAEHLQTQAEWALIAAAEQFFPGTTNDRLLCGTEKLDGLKTRQKYIDLLIGLVISAQKKLGFKVLGR